MSNSVVIKAEYRLIGTEGFTDLDIVPYSGSISETWKAPFQGKVAEVNVDFKKEGWTAANDETFKALLNRKAQYKITDADETVRLIGTDDVPARLTYQAIIGATAGSFNGYACAIKWLSPIGSEIE